MGVGEMGVGEMGLTHHLYPFHFVLFKFKNSAAKQLPTNLYAEVFILAKGLWVA